MAEEVGLQTQLALLSENLPERTSDAEDDQQLVVEAMDEEVDWSFGPEGDVNDEVVNPDDSELQEAETQKELDAANADTHTRLEELPHLP